MKVIARQLSDFYDKLPELPECTTINESWLLFKKGLLMTTDTSSHADFQIHGLISNYVGKYENNLHNEANPEGRSIYF